MECAYIGFGSNVGDREQYILRALHLLHASPSVTLLRVSSLYETEPTDGVEGDFFFNGAVKVSTLFSPLELLIFLQSVESQLGRKTGSHSEPRTIDLDILLYGTQIVETSNLLIPHPKMTRRSFVLVPLVEIEPHIHHPTDRRLFTDILSEIDSPTSVQFNKHLTIEDILPEASWR